MKHLTPSELKYHVQANHKDTHFFDRGTMRFFGDTMINYGCRFREDLQCYELRRKKPVKGGLQSSAYFDPETFKRIHYDKD